MLDHQKFRQIHTGDKQRESKRQLHLAQSSQVSSDSQRASSMGLRHPETCPCRFVRGQSEDFSSGAAVGCASTVVLVVSPVMASLAAKC